MPKYCSENERLKRQYAFYLEAANGKQTATIDAALKAIDRFEASTNRKPFSKFHVEQARAFRARLMDEPGMSGKPLSAATITSTLKHLRNFFLWLSREPGFRSAINPNDANYFTPSAQDVRIASARRENPIATLGISSGYWRSCLLVALWNSATGLSSLSPSSQAHGTVRWHLSV